MHRERNITSWVEEFQPGRLDAGGDFGLLEQIDKLLMGSLDIEGFRQRFAKVAWRIEAAADDSTIAFASRIENRIAEYSRGFVPDEVFRTVLRDDLAKFTQIFDQAISNPVRS